MKAPRTLTDLIKARNAAADREAVRRAREDAKAAKFTVARNLHPAIGALMTAKGVRYYAHIGEARVYREGSVEHLTALLLSA
jgi:hypothetical protein